MLSLAYGLRFEDLYTPSGLARLDTRFPEHLSEQAADLHAGLLAARAEPSALPRREESDLLIALGPCLESFLGRLFGIEAELAAFRIEHERLACLYSCKRQFVQRRA